jgi:hypothetical protein
MPLMSVGMAPGERIQSINVPPLLRPSAVIGEHRRGSQCGTQPHAEEKRRHARSRFAPAAQPKKDGHTHHHQHHQPAEKHKLEAQPLN